MKLTKSAWHYKFWKMNYGYKGWSEQEPNNNFCDYFWQLVWALLLFPISSLGHLYNKIVKDRNRFEEICYKGAIGWIVLVALLFLGNLFVIHPIAVLEAFGIIIGMTVGVVLIFWAVFSVADSEANAIAKEGWKSFKGKYCPKITWKS